MHHVGPAPRYGGEVEVGEEPNLAGACDDAMGKVGTRCAACGGDVWVARVRRAVRAHSVR